MDPANQALCAFACRLTEYPKTMSEAEIVTLRRAGFDDRAILDAVQIIGYFNYINRVADALGVEEETWLRPLQS